MNSLFDILFLSHVSLALMISGFDVSMVSHNDSFFDMILWQFTTKTRMLFLFGFFSFSRTGDEHGSGGPIMEDSLFVVALSEWSVRISTELSQLTSNEANRLLEKLGTPQLQQIQDASGLDRQSNIALVKPIQSL